MMQQPILIIIAGPNGSGKTSITSKILKHNWVENCAYVNPDNIAKETFGDWNSPMAVMKAAKFATKLREKYLKENKNFIFETVLSADDKIDFILKAKKQGYFIRLFFVSTDSPSINAARIAQRVMQGGHDVPITKIISRYSKSIANCSVASSIVDRAYFYDNSIEFEEPKLLFRSASGIIIKKYTNNINQWALPIFKSLKK